MQGENQKKTPEIQKFTFRSQAPARPCPSAPTDPPLHAHARPRQAAPAYHAAQSNIRAAPQRSAKTICATALAKSVLPTARSRVLTGRTRRPHPTSPRASAKPRHRDPLHANRPDKPCVALAKPCPAPRTRTRSPRSRVRVAARGAEEPQLLFRQPQHDLARVDTLAVEAGNDVAVLRA